MDEDVTDETAGAPKSSPATAAGGGTVIEAFPREGRISFILFLVVAMPIGIHHAFEDPQVGSGFKYLHSAFTAIVSMAL